MKPLKRVRASRRSFERHDVTREQIQAVLDFAPNPASLGACVAAYVTAGALQRRYPTAPGVFATHYGDAELPAGALQNR